MITGKSGCDTPRKHASVTTNSLKILRILWLVFVNWTYFSMRLIYTKIGTFCTKCMHITSFKYVQFAWQRRSGFRITLFLCVLFVQVYRPQKAAQSFCEFECLKKCYHGSSFYTAANKERSETILTQTSWSASSMQLMIWLIELKLWVTP